MLEVMRCTPASSEGSLNAEKYDRIFSRGGAMRGSEGRKSSSRIRDGCPVRVWEADDIFSKWCINISSTEVFDNVCSKKKHFSTFPGCGGGASAPCPCIWIRSPHPHTDLRPGRRHGLVKVCVLWVLLASFSNVSVLAARGRGVFLGETDMTANGRMRNTSAISQPFWLQISLTATSRVHRHRQTTRSSNTLTAWPSLATLPFILKFVSRSQLMTRPC